MLGRSLAERGRDGSGSHVKDGMVPVVTASWIAAKALGWVSSRDQRVILVRSLIRII
ncbi:hypothetical protein STANM309S_03538 [Streptomyces tanashiensis]